MNMEDFQEKEILKYKCRSCYKKLLFTSILIIVIASFIASIVIVIIFSSEAIRQIELNKPTSAGNWPPLHKGTKCDMRFKSSLNSARLNLLNPYK